MVPPISLGAPYHTRRPPILGVSNTHPPQLRVETESVSYINITRCERATSVTGVFFTVTWVCWI